MFKSITFGPSFMTSSNSKWTARVTEAIKGLSPEYTLKELARYPCGQNRLGYRAVLSNLSHKFPLMQKSSNQISSSGTAWKPE